MAPSPDRRHLRAVAHRRPPRHVGWSRKHLAARFGPEIGRPPKTIAHLARLGRTTGWADSAAGGFADQAHLMRDFRKVAGLAPTACAAATGGFEVVPIFETVSYA